MSKMQLCVAGVSEIVGSASLGLITLTDGAMERSISIICDPLSKSLLGLRMSGHGALCSKMLPEVMARVVGDMAEWRDFEIFIYNLVDGEYKAVLRNLDSMIEYQLRVSDAVLLSVVAQVSIYIDEALFFEQSTPYTSHSRMAVPINAISTTRLKEVLSKAIDTEDYRLASQIQEELKKRKDK